MTDTAIPAADPRAAARVIDALRRGWPVAIADGGHEVRLLAVENATPESLSAFDTAPQGMLIAQARAETLKLTNQRDAAQGDGPIAIAWTAWMTVDVAMAVADPVRDLSTPLKGPFRAMAMPAQGAAAAALQLARVAGLLPAYIIGAASGPVEARCTAEDISAFQDAGRLVIASRARLPVSAARETEIVAFRSADDAREHVALIIGKRGPSVPLVRVHSECLTGDVFGSLKCDCGPQLNHALSRMAADDWGILLYLRQEGRGIGLINKLRAYALQDQGFDTVDANIRLGFAIDARDFAIAAHMLELLGVERVRLLTNNPQKVARLESAGVRVTERVPHIVGIDPENERYMATKRDRTGHQL